jgi:hypothetical protein
MVLREGFEPSRPCGHHDLNVACLPFHHLSNFECMNKAACVAAVNLSMTANLCLVQTGLEFIIVR